MALVVTCSNCRMMFSAEAHLAGQILSCPSCGHPLQIPLLHQQLPDSPGMPVPRFDTLASRPTVQNVAQRAATGDDLFPMNKLLLIAGSIAGGALFLLAILIVVGSLRTKTVEPVVPVASNPPLVAPTKVSPEVDSSGPPITTGNSVPITPTLPVYTPRKHQAPFPQVAFTSDSPRAWTESPAVLDHLTYEFVEDIQFSPGPSPLMLIKGRWRGEMTPEMLKDYPFKYHARPSSGIDYPLAVEVYDWTNGEQRGRFFLSPAPGPFQRCRFLGDTIVASLFKASGESFRLVATQYSVEGEKLGELAVPQEVHNGNEFLQLLGGDGEKRLFVNNSTTLGVWGLPTGERESVPASLPKLTTAAMLSPTGKYLIQNASSRNPQDEAYLTAYEISSGKTALHLPQPFKEAGPVCLAFRSDGRAVAAIMHRRAGMDIVVWELPTGKLMHTFPLPIPRFDQKTLHWISPALVAVATSHITYLVDLNARTLVWKYELAAIGPREGWAWYWAGTPGQGELVPTQIPSPQVLAILQRYVPNTSNSFQTGDQFSIEITNETTTPRGFEKKLIQAVTAAANNAGYQVVRGAPKKLRIRLQKQEGPKELLFQRKGRIFETDVELRNDVLLATLELVTPQGQVVKSQQLKRSIAQIAPNEFQYRGSAQDALWEKCCDGMLAAASSYPLPPYASVEMSALEPPVGSSTFDARGENITPPK